MYLFNARPIFTSRAFYYLLIVKGRKDSFGSFLQVF